MTWFASEEGWQLMSSTILPFLAILLAGLFAAMVARGSIKRLLAQRLSEEKSAAIAALIGAGRKTVSWASLQEDERQRFDSLIGEADIRIRLLPVNGAAAAADWAAHELASMKTNSASFTFQAEQTFIDYRDRLLEWQEKPKRARKLFAFDLERWRYETAEKALADKQQEWPAGRIDGPELDEDDFEDAPATAVQLAVARQLGGGTSAQPATTMPVPDGIDPYSPPVTAGAVRQRIAPEDRIGL